VTVRGKEVLEERDVVYFRRAKFIARSRLNHVDESKIAT